MKLQTAEWHEISLSSGGATQPTRTGVLRSADPHRRRSIAVAPRNVYRRTVSVLRDWLFTLPFLVVFGVILLVFDAAQRMARLFGRRPHEYVVGALQWSLLRAFAISGVRLQVERSPHVRPHTPYLIVANHQSMFDVPIFGALFFTNFPKCVSKQMI
jgi:1-acyl-sn-glycerol-3-phosphate acyltransferase